ncbi:MAG: hypothetical protein V4689_02050 [Verrucomicrobiota bacterium]
MSTPARRFVILSIMRTGSNLLQQTLNAIDGVTCHGELLNHSPAALHPSLRHLIAGDKPAVSPTLWSEQPQRYLDTILGQTAGDHVGFRMFPDHHNPTLKALVEDPSVHKIILTRDLLESYTSLQLAQQNNQWIINHAGTRKPWAPITVNLDEFKNYALKNAAYYYHIISRCHVTGQHPTPIDYDKLNDPATLERLLAHFGPGRAFVPEAVTALRQNPEPLEQKIKNHAEVVKLLKRLRLDDWLFH